MISSEELERGLPRIYRTGYIELDTMYWMDNKGLIK
jgi:hypothetical protein